MIPVLIAAALFGAAFPLCKLAGKAWDPVTLAGALYLASGLGLLAARLAVRGGEPLRRSDLRWLAGSVLFGGILAPVAFVYGTVFTTGYAGSILGNLEAVFTAILAVIVFRERLSAREWAALALLVGGAAAVGAGTAGESAAARPLLGAALVALACFCWGIDNNFTKKISDRDPLQIACVKGLVAGATNLAIGLAMGQKVAVEAKPLVIAAGVGVLSYGASLALFVVGLRRLGSAKATALFSTSAVSGVLVSWLALGEVPKLAAIAGGAVMLAGVVTLSLSSAAPAASART